MALNAKMKTLKDKIVEREVVKKKLEDLDEAIEQITEPKKQKIKSNKKK